MNCFSFHLYQFRYQFQISFKQNGKTNKQKRAPSRLREMPGAVTRPNDTLFTFEREGARK
ncbi:MAG: hypothetical protein A2X94_02190 [Bdellovibrionales bacterium GWB1_55_8]|nr:MAG: hypothetical protein A2X94_02190 [Bdellovibrionales bacterium GWB1_55_8]